VFALIPFGDASRRPRSAAVTALIVVANVLVFLLEMAGGDRFVRHYAAIPILIVHGHRWSTLFTSMFLHGGWFHILGNMIFLWAFGPVIEEAMGSFKFLLFYLVGGALAMFAWVLVYPSSHTPCLGASGAIAAVMGAFLVLYPRDRIRSLRVIVIYFTVAVVPALLLIGFWFLIQLFSFGFIPTAGAGVAYFAHIAGFIFGALMAKSLASHRRTAPRTWQY
jgi:membrane associated rhomboid family serine protease